MATKNRKPPLVDERLVAALSHPTRAHALNVLTQRVASPKELAEELGIEVSLADYHVKKLVELDCVEQVSEKKRGAATEHFFRAMVRHYFDAGAWEHVPKKERLGITMGVLRLISNDLNDALQAGTADAIDRHLSRTPMAIDSEGWEQVVALLEGTLEGLLRIREEASERLAASGETPVQASVSIMQFEMPRKPAS